MATPRLHLVRLNKPKLAAVSVDIQMYRFKLLHNLLKEFANDATKNKDSIIYTRINNMFYNISLELPNLVFIEQVDNDDIQHEFTVSHIMFLSNCIEASRTRLNNIVQLVIHKIMPMKIMMKRLANDTTEDNLVGDLDCLTSLAKTQIAKIIYSQM